MPDHARRRIALLASVVVVVVSGGALAWAGSGSASPAYRTAVVQTGNVQQLLTLTGTSHVVAQTRSAFPADGVVAATPVRLGDHVVVGQVLAKIDPAPLQAAVVAASATLAAAQATLASDEAAASAPAAAVTPAPAASGSGTGGTTKGAATAAAVRVQGAAAQAALARATSACGGSESGRGPGSASAAPAKSPAPERTAPSATSPTPSSQPSGSPTTTASASPAGSPAAAGGSSTVAAGDCLAALTSALQAEQRLSQAQSSAGRSMPAGGAPTSTSTARTAAAAGAGAASTAGNGRASSALTSPAAQVTLATAAVQAAQVALSTAQQTLASAVLTSPLAGVVAVQPFVVGQAETRTQSITVVGSGAVQVIGNAPASALSSLRVGQTASVTADGATTPSHGTLSQIGLLPTTAANGTTTYPVTVLVAQPGNAFHDGGDAAVDLVTKSVSGALVVPNSAVRSGQVNLVRAGRLVPVRVQLGAVGALKAQVLAGLTAGQVVLLADPRQPLPANSTVNSRTFGGAGAAGSGRGPGGTAGAGGRNAPSPAG